MDELDYRTYGFTEADLGREIDLGGISTVTGILTEGKMTLGSLIERLKVI